MLEHVIKGYPLFNAIRMQKERKSNIIILKVHNVTEERVPAVEPTAGKLNAVNIKLISFAMNEICLHFRSHITL